LKIVQTLKIIIFKSVSTGEKIKTLHPDRILVVENKKSGQFIIIHQQNILKKNKIKRISKKKKLLTRTVRGIFLEKSFKNDRVFVSTFSPSAGGPKQMKSFQKRFS